MLNAEGNLSRDFLYGSAKSNLCDNVVSEIGYSQKAAVPICDMHNTTNCKEHVHIVTYQIITYIFITN